jgi:hypothetical protein
METSFMWDDAVVSYHPPISMPEDNIDCVRICPGDRFKVWGPNEAEDGGSVEYQLLVSEVEYFWDQTFGDPKKVTQYVFLKPLDAEELSKWGKKAKVKPLPKLPPKPIPDRRGLLGAGL